MSLHSLKQDFLEYLEIEKNRSQKTISNYDFYLSRFLDWLRSDKVSDITDEKIKDYRLHLNRLTDKDGENLKKNTQNYHLIALRAWLKYLSRKDIKTLAPEKIELMSMPDRDISFLLPEEVERLLAAPLLAFSRALKKNDQAKPPLNALRDKAIIELLFSTGMRVSELVGLKKETVNLNSEEFTVFGKGRKKRVVFLSESARAWLKKYLAGRHDLNPALFIAHGRRGGEEGEDGLTARSIERIIHAHAKAAGIMKPVTPHTLRHSYATDLLQNGADIRSVQSMLGHSSITTTQIYTHVTDKELKAVHKKFHGRKKIDK